MKKSFFILIAIIILIIFLWQGIYLPKSFDKKPEILFSLEKGQSLSQIAKSLENQGLIKNRVFFQIYLIFSGKYRKLQAGNYLLSPSMNIPEISQKFVLGKVAKIKITIPEGFNIKQIEERLNSILPLFKEGEIKIQNLKIADFAEDFEFLQDAPPDGNLEGFLFPDTYFFDYDTISAAAEIVSLTNSKKIVRKMLANFEKKLNPELREEIEKLNKSIFEIVIMASLLEREVKTKEEKAIISGILWKRLKNNIPLQVDATITYLTGKKTTKISKKDTQIDSPYNTYKYLGLPLGPICNPGLDSIKAAIYPKDSDFWYYLSTPGGKTIFSKTLKEHNLAKQKYLK